jgi:Flp pilus assembly protein TadG
MRDALSSVLVRALRRLRSDQSGQSLILVTLAMSVALGFAGISIDTASWYQKHHEAQVVADAAALAAANCLANPGVGPTGNVCSSSTDVSDAQQVAVNYAALNGLTITSSNVNVNTTNDTVQVTAPNTSPTMFARLIGINNTTQTASSTAGWSSGPAACNGTLQKEGLCYAIYAAGSTCSSSNGVVVSGSNMTINGGVHSQGSFNISGSNVTFNGPVTYSSGNCSPSESGSNLSGAYTPTAGDNEPSSYWPVNYATVFPACSTAAGTCTTSAAANGVSGSPTYCTQATTSSSGFTFTTVGETPQTPTSGNIYCAIGSGTVSNPATWNGPIIFSGINVGSSGSPTAITLIGGYVQISGSNVYLQPDASASNCQVYAAGANSSGYGLYVSGSNLGFSGSIFSPDGTINTGGSNITTTGLLEGQNVDASGLNITGDGPDAAGSGGSGSSGTDSLQQ